MKILLQDKNFVITNNSLISIDSNNIAENGNLVKIKQSSEKNDILKINNSLVRIKVASSLILPNKGDIIKMNLDGTDREYRVLKMYGNVGKIMGMWKSLTSKYNDSQDTNTTTMGTLTIQKYEDSTLDTYLNTWYNTLSTEAKNAIVPENIICDAWHYSDSSSINENPGNPAYTGTYGNSTIGTINYRVGKYTGGILNIGSRNIFALGVQDIIDYLSDESMRVDTNVILKNVNIWKMFWNDEIKHSGESFWLKSVNADTKNGGWYVSGYSGGLGVSTVDMSYSVNPAFNIDLSKIEWSTTT